MKDIFIPVLLGALVIVIAILFVAGVFNPQKQTMDALATSSQKSEVGLVALADGNNDEVSGTVVGATYDQYGTAVVKIYETDGTTAITRASLVSTDTFVQTVTRNTADKTLKQIKFVKK